MKYNQLQNNTEAAQIRSEITQYSAVLSATHRLCMRLHNHPAIDDDAYEAIREERDKLLDAIKAELMPLEGRFTYEKLKEMGV